MGHSTSVLTRPSMRSRTSSEFRGGAKDGTVDVVVSLSAEDVLRTTDVRLKRFVLRNLPKHCAQILKEMRISLFGTLGIQDAYAWDSQPDQG